MVSKLRLSGMSFQGPYPFYVSFTLPNYLGGQMQIAIYTLFLVRPLDRITIKPSDDFYEIKTLSLV